MMVALGARDEPAFPTGGAELSRTPPRGRGTDRKQGAASRIPCCRRPWPLDRVRAVKPTMPMSPFPPGGPPGIPPGGGYPPPGGGGFPPPGGGGGWGTPPPGGGGWGTPPPGGGFPPPAVAPPPKSKTGLYVGLGCGCLLLLACVIGGVLYAAGGMHGLLGPGEEVVSTPIVFGQPFSLTYVQSGSQKYEAWIEVDVDYTAGYNLTGTILMSENGSPFGQYTLAEDGEGSPVAERRTDKRVGWEATNLAGSGSAEGKVSIFPIPARTSGAQITLSGTIHASPGTSGSVRLFVAERN